MSLLAAPQLRPLPADIPPCPIGNLLEDADRWRSALRSPSFNHWEHGDSALVQFLLFIFEDTLCTEVRDSAQQQQPPMSPPSLSLDRSTLWRFLWAVHTNYNHHNPYHNFQHCFCVTQLIYSLIFMNQLQERLTPLERLALLFAAVCHDLDHPGLNNAYQVNAQTSLARIYNDQSPLENYHCALAFALLQQDSTNITRHVSKSDWQWFRKSVIRCILATDMTKQAGILQSFQAALVATKEDRTQFWSNLEYRQLLLLMLVKCADVGNETRDLHVSERWSHRLFEEFFAQADQEKAQGLPAAPFMDREKVNVEEAQIGFIAGILMPMYSALAELLPSVREHFLSGLDSSLAYYKEKKRVSL